MWYTGASGAGKGIMPIEFEVVSGIIVSRCSGVVTGRDIRNVIASYVDNGEAGTVHTHVRR